MKTNYLFPNRFKTIGWIFLIPSLLIGVYTLVEDCEPSLFDAILPILLDSCYMDTDSLENLFFDNEDALSAVEEPLFWKSTASNAAMTALTSLSPSRWRKA